MNRDKPLQERVGHSLLTVRIIGVAKLLKAAVLVTVGILILHVLHIGGDAHDALLELVNAIRLDQNNHYIHTLLEKTLGVQHNTLRMLGVGTLIYSALYGIEGMGLIFDKGWAEWMTVITTFGFIPLELNEIARHPSALHILVFVINAAILVYIAMRIRWRHLAKVKMREKVEELDRRAERELHGREVQEGAGG